MSSSVNMEDPSTSIDTNKDEQGNLLFPGQQLARRSSVLNKKVLNQLDSERPVFMRKKTRWAESSDDDDDEDKSSDSQGDGEQDGDNGS